MPLRHSVCCDFCLTPGAKEQRAESTGGACRLPSTCQNSEDGTPAFLELKVLRHLYREGDPLVWPGGRTEGGAEIYLKSELGGHLPRLVYLRPLSVEWLGV